MTIKLTTGERLMKLETQVTDIKSSLEEHKLEQRKDFDKLFTKLDGLDDKYSSKWVEKAVITIGVGLSTAIVGALIYLL